jgi:hypothetical protein
MIRQKTFDLLDASLRSDNNSYLNYKPEDRTIFYSTKPYRIDPWWSNQKLLEIEKFPFDWSAPVKYSEYKDFRTIIPTEDTGIYLFFVAPNRLVYDLPRTVLYVGISGDRGSKRPLRERLNDYYKISNIKKRSNIHKLLQLYFDDLYIAYSLYSGDFKELLKLETALTEFFSAPYSNAAYEPPTRKGRNTWR